VSLPPHRFACQTFVIKFFLQNLLMNFMYFIKALYDLKLITPFLV